MVSIGIVSVESTHVDAYCRLLNSPDGLDGMHVDGARIAALCPGESPAKRVRELQEAYGIPDVYDEPGDMVDRVHAAMILARNGDLHQGHARPFLEAGKPTFVDKPFAHTTTDSAAMVRSARENAAPLMSCSSLRYSIELAHMRAHTPQLGRISHCHCSGPGELFFYGVHLVEMAHTVLGRGIASVANLADEHRDLMALQWEDGRTASLSLVRNAEIGFHCSVFSAEGEYHTPVADLAYYRNQLERFVDMCRTSVEPIPLDDTLEIIRALVAAEVSRNGDGVRVFLGDL